MRERIASKLAETCEVVATAADGISALSAVESLNPAVVILDVSMPNMSGIEVAARLRGRGCAIHIVFYSAHDDEDLQCAAAALGVKAFVRKPNLAVLADAVRES
jgi:DNA-binding NarL/FixJ family response regulator